MTDETKQLINDLMSALHDAHNAITHADNALFEAKQAKGDAENAKSKILMAIESLKVSREAVLNTRVALSKEEKMTKSRRVVIGNSVYTLVEAEDGTSNAVLQALLQQYETAADAMAKALKNSYQAAMGKNFDQATQTLDKYIKCEYIDKLKDLIGDMNGAVQMG